jgi:hypothetical protein
MFIMGRKIEEATENIRNTRVLSFSPNYALPNYTPQFNQSRLTVPLKIVSTFHRTESRDDNTYYSTIRVVQSSNTNCSTANNSKFVTRK